MMSDTAAFVCAACSPQRLITRRHAFPCMAGIVLLDQAVSSQPPTPSPPPPPLPASEQPPAVVGAPVLPEPLRTAQDCH